MRSVRRDREAGFTLVEMLVAIAIFGVLAAAGYRVLDTVLVTRERVTQDYRQWRDVARAVAWMERDLAAAHARPVRGPADQVLAPVLGVETAQPGQPVITFTRSGSIDASGFATPPRRIGYRGSQASLCFCTPLTITVRHELTFGSLRYSFGGDHPSQTTHHAMSFLKKLGSK